MTLVRQASPQGRRIKSRGRTNLRHLNSRESENGLHAHFGNAEQLKSYQLWPVDTFLFREAFGNILQVIFGIRKSTAPKLSAVDHIVKHIHCVTRANLR
jgi:hypothetical protein